MNGVPDSELLQALENDPKLRELSKQAADHSGDLRDLLQIFSAHYSIGHLPVPPLRAAVWSLLYALDLTPIFLSREAVTDNQLDMALYIVSRPDIRGLDCSPETLPARSSGYRAATGLSAEQCRAELAEIALSAFAPLSMIPADSDNATSEPTFDADWLIRITGIAARSSNSTAEYCMFTMPLATVCGFFVDFLRRESPRFAGISRRTREGVTRRIIERMKEVKLEYLAQCRQS